MTRQTDLALEVYIGNQTTPGFNTLHTMAIRAGYASGIPFFPDWVNFSNQSLAYLISTSQPPDYPDELNLEAILHIPAPEPATSLDWTGPGTLNTALDVSAEMYNQTWNHLEETELLTRDKVNDIIRAQ